MPALNGEILSRRIGHRFRLWRELSRHTQLDASKLLGCSITMVHMFESGGKKLSLDFLSRICDVTGLPPEEFVKHEDPLPMAVTAACAMADVKDQTQRLSACVDNLYGVVVKG